MKTLKLNPSVSLYYYYVVVYYLSLVIICYSAENPRIWPLFIWTTMFMVIFFMIKHPWKQRRPRKHLRKRALSNYEKMVMFSQMASLLFLACCLCFNLFSSVIPAAMVFLGSVLFFYLAVMLYLSNLDSYSAPYRSCLTWLLRILWLGITVYCYAQSRHFFMEVADLPYEQTASRLSVLVFATVQGAQWILLLLLPASIVPTFLEQAQYEIRGRKLNVKQSSLPLVIPLFFTSYITMILSFSHFRDINNYLFNETLPADTRSTFYCHKQYLTLPGNATYRYLFVADNDYRMFRKTSSSWEVSRLTCQENAPYYTLTPVQTYQDIVQKRLKSAAEELHKELSAVSRGGTLR